MAKAVEIKLGKDALAFIAHLKKELTPQGFYQRVDRFFTAAGVNIVRLITQKYFHRRARGEHGPAPFLRSRSGELAKSIIYKNERFSGLPALRVGSLRGPAMKYARIQEQGGTVTPKRAKALAMPTEKALTASGRPKWHSPRQYPGKLHFIPFRRSGIAVGALYDAKDVKRMQRDARKNERSFRLSKYKALWILLKQTTIKGKFFIRGGFEQYLPKLTQDLANFLRDLFIVTTPSGQARGRAIG